MKFLVFWEVIFNCFVEMGHFFYGNTSGKILSVFGNVVGFPIVKEGV